MNYNILSYLIYGLITVFTIVYIGRVLHQNGRHYVLRIFHEVQIGDFINNGLLVGYYLFNIGYVLITLNQWQQIRNVVQMIEILGEKTGAILLLLGVLHFFNIFVLKVYAHLNNIDLGMAKK